MLRASNIGTPVTLGEPNSAPARAYMDAARRLNGADIADDRSRTTASGLFGRLFGRRAA